MMAILPVLLVLVLLVVLLVLLVVLLVLLVLLWRRWRLVVLVQWLLLCVGGLARMRPHGADHPTAPAMSSLTSAG